MMSSDWPDFSARRKLEAGERVLIARGDLAYTIAMKTAFTTGW